MMKHESFAALVLTHGRANKVVTAKKLRQFGYTGRIIIVIDDEDDQAPKYMKRFGDDVKVFCKQDIYNRIDTMDNFHKMGAVVYARNAAFDIAEAEGLEYFLELDDDYDDFEFRWVEGNKLKRKHMTNLDRVFDLMLDFLDASGAATVAMSQGGDYLGGAKSPYSNRGLTRKAMNVFFLRTDRRFEFKGSINEDTNTYTTEAQRGKLFLSYTRTAIHQGDTQTVEGGMTDLYLDNGTYVKTFYSVIGMPSAVRVSIMGEKHKRMHHRVNWNHCTPMILSDAYKRANSGR